MTVEGLDDSHISDDFADSLDRALRSWVFDVNVEIVRLEWFGSSQMEHERSSLYHFPKP